MLNASVRQEDNPSETFLMYRKTASQFTCWTHVNKPIENKFLIVSVFNDGQFLDSAIISPEQLFEAREQLTIGACTLPCKTKTGAHLQILALGKCIGRRYQSSYFSNRLSQDFDLWTLLYGAPGTTIGVHHSVATVSAFAIVQQLVRESFCFTGFHKQTYVPEYKSDWNVALKRFDSFEEVCTRLSFTKSPFHSLCIGLLVYHSVWHLDQYTDIDFEKYLLSCLWRRKVLKHLRLHKPALVYEGGQFAFKLIGSGSEPTSFSIFQNEDGSVVAHHQGEEFKIGWSELTDLSGRTVSINFEPIYRPIIDYSEFTIQGKVSVETRNKL